MEPRFLYSFNGYEVKKLEIVKETEKTFRATYYIGKHPITDTIRKADLDIQIHGRIISFDKEKIKALIDQWIRNYTIRTAELKSVRDSL